MRILVCGDFHGNEKQFECVRRYVAECNCSGPPGVSSDGDEPPLKRPNAGSRRIDVVCYVGDYSANRFMYDTPEKARAFAESVTFPVFASIPCRYKYLIPGNTDFHVNNLLFEKRYSTDDSDSFRFIVNDVVLLAPELSRKIYGLFFSFTRISSHSLKDGEAFDMDGEYGLLDGRKVTYTKLQVVQGRRDQGDAAGPSQARESVSPSGNLISAGISVGGPVFPAQSPPDGVFRPPRVPIVALDDATGPDYKMTPEVLEIVKEKDKLHLNNPVTRVDHYTKNRRSRKRAAAWDSQPLTEGKARRAEGLVFPVSDGRGRGSTGGSAGTTRVSSAADPESLVDAFSAYAQRIGLCTEGVVSVCQTETESEPSTVPQGAETPPSQSACQSEPPAAAKIVMADALRYDSQIFQRVGLLRPQTHPRWFSANLSTSLFQKLWALYSRFESISGAGRSIEGSAPAILPLWFTHSPVFQTCGDIVQSGDHVGSHGMRHLLENFHRLFPSLRRPSAVVSGHIHESSRSGVFACAEAYPAVRVDPSHPSYGPGCPEVPKPSEMPAESPASPFEVTTFCTIGNEGLSIPQCLKCSFLILDVGEDGSVLRVERVVRDVELYADATESFHLFKQSVHAFQKALE